MKSHDSDILRAAPEDFLELERAGDKTLRGGDMALPVAGIAARAVFAAVKNPGVGLIGAIFASGFVAERMIEQAADSAIKVWPVLGIAFLFLLIREAIRQYAKIQKNKKLGVPHESE